MQCLESNCIIENNCVVTTDFSILVLGHNFKRWKRYIEGFPKHTNRIFDIIPFWFQFILNWLEFGMQTESTVGFEVTTYLNKIFYFSDTSKRTTLLSV